MKKKRGRIIAKVEKKAREDLGSSGSHTEVGKEEEGPQRRKAENIMEVYQEATLLGKSWPKGKGDRRGCQVYKWVRKGPKS